LTGKPKREKLIFFTLFELKEMAELSRAQLLSMLHAHLDNNVQEARDDLNEKTRSLDSLRKFYEAAKKHLNEQQAKVDAALLALLRLEQKKECLEDVSDQGEDDSDWIPVEKPKDADVPQDAQHQGWLGALLRIVGA
jgi:DNA polymerase III epsilon subunit-like protein